MTATETLKHEHQIILLVLDAAERESARIRQTLQLRSERTRDMIEFFRHFADRCHHAKEESILFVKMEERGLPVQGGPIGVMLQEHAQGRQLVQATAEVLPQAEQGDAAALVSASENLANFVRLLRAHIRKEDTILYPMADQLFTEHDQRELAVAFDRVEAEEMGKGVHERYHELAHDLAAE